jgi:hypothetical protein
MPNDFSFRYSIAALALGLTAIVLFYVESRGIFFTIPFLKLLEIICFIALALSYLMMFGDFLLDGRFARAFSALLGLFVLVAFAFERLPLARGGATVFDTLRFELSRSYYSNIVRNISGDGAPKLVKFDWGLQSTFLAAT